MCRDRFDPDHVYRSGGFRTGQCQPGKRVHRRPDAARKRTGCDSLYRRSCDERGCCGGTAYAGTYVDTVLYFEGDRHASYRILRGVKNRFGSTNEIGVFEMREEGLAEVPNPSEFMLEGRPAEASGAVTACSMEGTRPILLEVQALVSKTNFGLPRRTAAGVDYNRVNLLMAVLENDAVMPVRVRCLCQHCRRHEDERAGA